MKLMVLDRFSGGNPTGWISRAEQYFTYLGFSKKEWLSLAPFYLDGAAYDWFQWLYGNKQFFDWKHFTEKLALHFCNDSNRINDSVNALDMMWKFDENFSYILCKLDNVQRALSAYSQSIVADPVPLDMDDKGDSALSFDESTLVFEDFVASDSDIVDECIQPSVQACVVQTHLQVLLSNLPFDLNNGTLEEVNGGTLEEVSGISACKVFAKIPDRDIDMKVADSVKNDVVKPETHVFDERFHIISTDRCDSTNLIKFEQILFSLPCMILACSFNNGIFAYLSEVDPTKIPLSFYRFSPAQIKLKFPFDPGSGMLTTFLSSARYYSFMVVDDFKKNIKIFFRHFDSMTSDQCTLNQFPYDPGANLFIVTVGGRLQVHRLHPATFVYTLLLVMDTFQLFWSVSYIRPSVEPAKPLTENEPTISIWDPGISSQFMIVIGSTDKVKISEFILSTKFGYKLLEQLVGNQLRVARRRNKWVALSFWIRTGESIKLTILQCRRKTHLSISLVVSTQSLWSFLPLVCNYVVTFSCFVTLQHVLCQMADGERDGCELLCYVFLILTIFTRAFQHQHNLVELLRCAAMRMEFIQLKGGSLVSYCADIPEVGDWFLVRLQPYRQPFMRLQLGNPLRKQHCLPFKVLKCILILPCILEPFDADQNYSVFSYNSRLKHCHNQLNQQSMLLQNLEDKVLNSGRSIVVNQTDYTRAYGLERVNETDPFKITGPIKMLESFIWDPGPIINWLNRSWDYTKEVMQIMSKRWLSVISHLHSQF